MRLPARRYHRSAVGLPDLLSITLALAAGVRLELVQRVTGHRTVAVVMKHYFRPGWEDLRAAIFKAMPKMLADGGQRSVKEKMQRVVEASRRRHGRGSRPNAKLLKLIASV